MAYGSIPSHIPKLRNSWIIPAAPWSGHWHRASTRLLPPTWGPPVTAAPYSLLEDRQCSVVGGDCICSWTAHYAVPYLALLRHRKKYENMIYSSGLGPSWDQPRTGNTNVNWDRDISTATAAPPAILPSICPKRMVQLSPVRPFLD